MHLREYLDRAIKEFERGVWIREMQLTIDRGYVESSDADPADIDYYRCQVELNALEREGLQGRLVILKEWLADPRSNAPHMRAV
jgi:hypothetical protein